MSDFASEPRATAPAPSPLQQSLCEQRWTASAIGWLIALLGWSVFISFYHLDGGSGFEPIECWVAQTAREMYESSAWRDWMVPRFAGETRMQKSPGAYWAVCLVSALRGAPIDEVSARAPNALAAVILAATVFWLTLRIAGERAAIFAGFSVASSVFLLHRSHTGSSDLGVTALMTLSLACLFIGSEHTDRRSTQVWLWLAGYFAAGLSMLYKMPMPLLCVGPPAVAYVALRWRWSIFASRWHLLGLATFCLPWAPWAIYAGVSESAALDKWRVEFWDRFTGDLPNVQSQQPWEAYFLYLGTAAVFAFPYTLSLPLALIRMFRRSEKVDDAGRWFTLIWFLGLFLLFSVSSGKETRYFLPAMPPLFIMLGVELAEFFRPGGNRGPAWRWSVFSVIALLTVGGAVAGAYGLAHWREATAMTDVISWPDLRQIYAITIGIFAAGVILSAALFAARRANASFGALVFATWATFLYAWPNLMPIMMSQAPARDFAAQLRERLTPAQLADVRQVGQHDPRYVWYADARFPRVIDQLKLLEMQGGRRSLDAEVRLIGEEMVRRLEAPAPALFVSAIEDYVRFQAGAWAELKAAGREMPPTHLWIVSNVGRYDRRFVLFGNQPPPWTEPAPEWLSAVIERARHKALSASMKTETKPN